MSRFKNSQDKRSGRELLGVKQILGHVIDLNFNKVQGFISATLHFVLNSVLELENLFWLVFLGGLKSIDYWLFHLFTSFFTCTTLLLSMCTVCTVQVQPTGRYFSSFIYFPSFFYFLGRLFNYLRF